jgi:hypothetical protein
VEVIGQSPEELVRIVPPWSAAWESAALDFASNLNSYVGAVTDISPAADSQWQRAL